MSTPFDLGPDAVWYAQGAAVRVIFDADGQIAQQRNDGQVLVVDDEDAETTFWIDPQSLSGTES